MPDRRTEASRQRLSLCLPLALTLVAPLTEARNGDPSRGLPDLLARAAGYVSRYEQELGQVVAREDYTQRTSRLRSAGSPGLLLRRAARSYRVDAEKRQLVSDFLLIYGAHGWQGFRDVLEVDGEQVRDREDRLQRLFLDQSADASAQWRRVLEESARYNIGSVHRDLNIPTFALLVLRPENMPRFVFGHDGSARVDGLATAIIHFEEERGPALVQTDDHAPVFLSGRFWVEPGSGRVVGSEIVVGDPDDPNAKIEVTYRRGDDLELWLPYEMKELYRTPDREEIRTEARYSEFRRFEVSTEGDFDSPR